jgi:hypothetical protein
MSATRWVVTVLSLALIGAVLAAPLYRPELRRASTWQRMASPGELSAAHSFLGKDCAACHTAVKGAEASKCIACHAGDESLLARQPTAFHADIGSCRECHVEHQGASAPPPAMDHDALARIGLRSLRGDPASAPAYEQLIGWIRQDHSRDAETHVQDALTPPESTLHCSTCHGTKDRHRGLFGEDCAQCHSTAQWTISRFRHPSPQSTDCAQCHQAPPSHYMEHFHMISARVAQQEHAQVNQCYLCHQTTSWNDIRGVGWYKHH